MLKQAFVLINFDRENGIVTMKLEIYLTDWSFLKNLYIQYKNLRAGDSLMADVDVGYAVTHRSSHNIDSLRVREVQVTHSFSGVLLYLPATYLTKYT